MTFETYWREFGKLEHEVIKNPRELEEDFYNFAKKIWDLNNDRINKLNDEMDEKLNDAYREGKRDGIEESK